MTHHCKILLLSGLLLITSTTQAEEKKQPDTEKPYVYCLLFDFSNPEEIKSATFKAYDHPWYKLYRPREVINASFTDLAGKYCWRSALPEMGLSLSYTVKEGAGINRSYRCRKAPLPMKKYKAKTWQVTIRKKTADESHPIDCEIK